MIESACVLRPNAARVAAKVLDGEAVIIDLTTGVYYSLTDVGGRAWALVEAGLPLSRMAEVIAAEYGVPPTQARADLDALVTSLVAEQLVTTERDDPTAVDIDVPEAPPATGPREYRAPELQIYRDMQDLLALDPPMPGLQDIPWK